jgi:hypothetical protein
MSNFSSSSRALGILIGVPLAVVLVLFLANMFHRCHAVIEGEKEEIGAKVYINDQYVGVIKKYRESEFIDDLIFSRLCTWFKKGDSLRIEKEGYQTYTAILDPYVNDSGPPDYVVHVRLGPLSEGEGSKSH